MHLFLASKFSSVGDRFLELAPETKGGIVAFVPTAADPYEAKPFVEDDKKKLRELGYEVREVDIKSSSPAQLKATISDADVLFVAGGNVFYLLEKTEESGFGQAIQEFIAQDRWYVGSSAGSILLGPSVEPFKELEYDPAIAPNLKSFAALNIVDFIILPHVQKEKYKAMNDKVIEHCKGMYKLYTLTDEQLVVVQGESVQLIR